MVETVRIDEPINWAVLTLMLVVVVFKFLLWRLTKFWPFLMLVVAFSYVAGTRVDLILDPHAHTNDWVAGFWPLCTVGVVALYLFLRKNMLAPTRHFGRRKDDLALPRAGRRKGDLHHH